MPPVRNVQALGEPGFGFQKPEQQDENEQRRNTLERARDLDRSMRDFNDNPVGGIEGSQGGTPVFSSPGGPGGAGPAAAEATAGGAEAAGAAGGAGGLAELAPLAELAI